MAWKPNLLCRTVLVAGAVVLAMVAGPAWADDFTAYLSPSPVTGGTRDSITGQGDVKARLDGNHLHIQGDFQGLASNATGAQLYAGAGIGVPGPKLFDLTATSGQDGTLSGDVQLNAEQVRQLRRGHVYVQVNSQGAPAPYGNLRGWLFPPHPVPGQDVPVKGHGFLPQLDVPQQ